MTFAPNEISVPEHDVGDLGVPLSRVWALEFDPALVGHRSSPEKSSTDPGAASVAMHLGRLW